MGTPSGCQKPSVYLASPMYLYSGRGRRRSPSSPRTVVGGAPARPCSTQRGYMTQAQGAPPKYGAF